MTKLHIALMLLGLALVVILAICRNCALAEPIQPKPTPSRDSKVSLLKGEQKVVNNRKSKLDIDLSSGQVSQDNAISETLGNTSPLSDVATQKLLKRLPALASDESLRTDFAKRKDTLPAPRTGETVSVPFPAPREMAPPTPPKDEDIDPQKLSVLRFAPEGDVPIAPFVSVTFSQPMVELSSQTEVAKNVPVKLEPQPEGKWRWIGTKTIIFEAKDQRLPMATSYKVTIPQGTKSANGKTLEEEVSFNFSTPTLKLTSLTPNGDNNRLDPLMLLSFNQKIDASQIMSSISLTADDQSLEFRQATETELKADSGAQLKMEGYPTDRFLAIKALKELPKASDIEVTLRKGAISAEGPLKTTSTQSRTFRTYDPFRFKEYHCGWGDKPAPPGTPWTLVFNNTIDDDKFDPSAHISISPELEGMRVSCSGSNITICGNSKGLTTYKVTIDSSLQDIYGQTLSKDVSCSIKMGSADPGIQTVGGDTIVLDPSGPRSYSIYTINEPELDVTIQSVQPSDYEQFRQYRSEQQSWRVRNGREKAKIKIPGKKVFSKGVKTSKEKDIFVESRLDLSPAFNKQGLGHAIIVIRPKHIKNHEPIITWIQATNIGLSTYGDAKDLYAFASDLATGKPLTDVTIDGIAVNEQGIAKIGPIDSDILLAKRGEDTAFFGSVRSLRPHQNEDVYKWYAFSDRGIYKPNEKANFKGWLRLMTAGPKGDIVPVAPSIISSVSWTATDARNNEFAKGECPLNPYGGFDVELTLPDNINLGTARLKVMATFNDPEKNKMAKSRFGFRSNHSVTVNFEVQEFRRPEFEVQTKNEQSLNLIGETSKVSAIAKYYAGGILPNAKTRWDVTANSSVYSPPGWDKFIFGIWRPWWHCHWIPEDIEPKIRASFQNTTDNDGKSVLSLGFASTGEAEAAPLSPTSVKVSASVSDKNEQTWSSNTSLLVHPSKLYVGLNPKRQFVEKDSPINIEYIVTDIDGKVQEGKTVKVSSAQMTSVYRNGKEIDIEDDIKEQTLTSGKVPQTFTINPKLGGRYRITAEVSDSKGRRNRTQLVIWVAGGPQIKERTIQEGKIELIPDKKEYKAGEIAEVLVVAPFAPSEGSYTINRSGIVSTQRFSMDSTSHTLKVPIEEAYTPNIYLHVQLVGQQDRANDDGSVASDAPKQPAYASGTINLSIPPYERTLDLEITPKSKTVAPGANTSLDILLKDKAGNPLSDSEVSIAVIDESILALVAHKIPDPIESFYAQRNNSYHSRNLRSIVQLADPSALEPATVERDDDLERVELRESMGAGAVSRTLFKAINNFASPTESSMAVYQDEATAASSDEPTSDTAIAVRSDFNPQALWTASVHTDKNGRAHVAYRLPDNLTRYRITAIAADKTNKFGYAESSLTACLPLMVRPSLPRFLNFGDKAELPVLIQNQSDKQLTVNVAVRAQNLNLEAPVGKTLTIPANDRREVRFSASVQEVGKARVQIVASAGDYSDAAEVTIPVWTPCTSEAFATYGQIDDGAIKQPIKYPQEVWNQFGGLEITTSSTAVQELTDAFISLQEYPFSCTEQLSSRLLSALALKDVLTAFKAEGMPSEKDLKERLESDIENLLKRQESNGGFRFWDNSEKIYPYCSLHAVRALVYLRGSEYGNSDRIEKAISKGLRYVENIDRYLTREYSEPQRRMLRAYACDILREAEKPDVQLALNIHNSCPLDEQDLDTIGWILPTLSQQSNANAEAKQATEDIRRLLTNRLTETAGKANFSASYSDKNHLLFNSDRRTDGILLRAMIIDQPKSDIIPKLVRGLLAHRKRGAWGNTQENAFILIALNDYFNTYEKVTPDFVANIWLGQDYAGKHSYKGRTTEYQETKVPMSYIASHPTTDLIMAKEGQGRLYYRLGLKYAPKSLKLDPMECGFEVVRSYEGVDDPDDVKRLADGTWQIKLGSRVACKTTMIVPSRRYHVALVNPLPAGLEALNPTLRVTEPVPNVQKDDDKNTFWWWGPWYEQANLRDERAEAFASIVYSGSYEYNFVARATTPGTFIVPPAKAEEMYSPEVFGRSSSDKVIVK